MIFEADAPIAPEVAAPADAEALRALYAAGGWRSRSRSWQELEERIALGEVAVLRRERQVVASVTVIWTDEARWGPAGWDGQAGYVHALVRDRERTAPGLGAQLLAWAETSIAARGRRLSRLDTRAECSRLVRYYEAHAYRVVGTRTYSWTPDPLTLLEKRLAPPSTTGTAVSESASVPESLGAVSRLVRPPPPRPSRPGRRSGPTPNRSGIARRRVRKSASRSTSAAKAQVPRGTLGGY